MTHGSNRRIVFPARPDRRLEVSDFALESVEIGAPAEGEVLVASQVLAIDPGSVLRLTGRAPFAPPYHLGDLIPGTAVGVVEASRHPAYRPGDTVVGPLGWQEFALVDGDALEAWDFGDLPATLALTALGTPGLTGYFGVELGNVRPGDSVVISSAAGSVGMFAAQVAKLRGARVVGIAGGPEKCAWLKTELNLDEAADYKAETDLVGALKRACPAGVDMYLDLVGGDILNAVLAVASQGARFILCGAISEFDDPDGRHGLRHLTWVITKNIKLEGFVLPRFRPSFPTARAELAAWIRQDRIRSREQVFNGLEAAPSAMLGLIRGQSFGRSLVRVGGEGR